MKFEIKNRWNGTVIFSVEARNFKLALEAAIKAKANLSSANLSSANLSSADLSSANLRSADLSSADLSSADLRWADLSSANLSSANLSSADLSSADLSSADLSSAKAKKVLHWPSPPMLLLCNWLNISDALCLDLMRYDAFNHPKPEKFLYWADNGICPYESVKVERSARFTEKRSLIKEDFLSIPVKSAYELMRALLAECCDKEEK